MMTMREFQRSSVSSVWSFVSQVLQIRPYRYILYVVERILFPCTAFEKRHTRTTQPLSCKIGLIARQEVPFECWAYDHDRNLDTCLGTVKARSFAVVSLVEGSVRTTVEATAYLITKLFEVSMYQPEHTSTKRLAVLNVQWTGMRLSAYALFSPKAAVIRAHQLAGKKIFATTSHFPWGTQYLDKRRFFLPIESSGYPWPGRHTNV